MSFKIRVLSPSEWDVLSESAHKIAFGEIRPRGMDRADYALLATDDSDAPSGYISCLEMDRETLYWQFGGAMPNYKGTFYTLRGYQRFVDFCRKDYRFIKTKISATNTPMLKMALRVGFLITGTETMNDTTYVWLCLETKGDKS